MMKPTMLVTVLFSLVDVAIGTSGWRFLPMDKEPRHSGAGRNPEGAGSGVAVECSPISVGKGGGGESRVGIGVGGTWIPACAGMAGVLAGDESLAVWIEQTGAPA